MMAEVVRALIQAPATARAGEVITIRATIAHPMETGYRRGSDGQMLARDLIRRFVCRFNDQVVFSARLHAAVAANPYVAFSLQAKQSGMLSFSWEGDKGFSHTRTQALTVT
jgi:sulfur-oxidizing protein SoxZ